MSATPEDALQAWSGRLSRLPLPVLRATRDAIDALREHSERADAHQLAGVALRDPMLCAQLIAHAAGGLSARLDTPVETVTGALVLMGVEPFFRAFGELPVVEDALAGSPQGLAGVLAAVERSHAAARMAAAIAIHRQDGDVELLHQGALLHGVATVMAWCADPPLCARMAQRQAREPGLRCVDVQRQEMGAGLHEIGRALMARWGFPPSLQALAEPAGSGPGPRTVALAVRVARHAALPGGWSHPALQADLEEAGLLLNLPPQGAAALLRRAVE